VLLALLIEVRAVRGLHLRVVRRDFLQEGGGIKLLDVEWQTARAISVFHQVPFPFVGQSRGPCGFVEAKPVAHIEISQFGIVREGAFTTYERSQDDYD
jgi:hypothetical protein